MTQIKTPDETIPEWVSTFIGIPYVDGGRDRHGLDCWGLVRMVLGAKWGIRLPAHDEIGFRTPASTDRRVVLAHWRELAARMAVSEEWRDWRPVGVKDVATGKWVTTEPERAGDVAVIRTAGQPIHVGVVVARPWLLHADHGVDSVCECYTDPRLAPRLLGIYRHRSMGGA